MKRTLLAAALALCAASAQADVTITSKTEGKAAFIQLGGDSLIQVKGNKLRTEQAQGKKTQVFIIDVDGQRFINLDDAKKTALVTPLSVIKKNLEAVGVTGLKASLKKTAAVKNVAGYPCTVHDVAISMPFNPSGGAPQPGMDLTIELTGTVCLSPQAPGQADYARFYRAAADQGFIFGDPKAANSPAGAAQARVYAALMKKMVEGGMVLDSHILIKVGGAEPMATIMGKMAKSDITSTAKKVQTGALAAALFEIPAGYKVKTQK